MALPGAYIDIQLTDGPVTSREIAPFPPECGAECVFLGRTRHEQHATHGDLIRLHYQAHATMAQQVLLELAHTSIERHDCRAVRIHHAVGDVAIGQASVLVQTACGHRSAAFDACRFLIDALKEQAPIWKQEIWSNGAAWVTGHPVRMT